MAETLAHRASAAPSERALPLAGLVLLLAALLLSLAPGIASVPPIDRDEPRYTQATKQMLETGDYVRIRYQQAPRHKKPIGIHWLQAGAATLVGEGAASPLWVYRLPSLFGAVSAVLLTVWAARAFLPLQGALAVGLLLGATIIVGVEARLAKTDAVLLASILACQGALARIWLAKQGSWRMPLLFWGALGLGVLVKGPIAPMVVGATVAVLGLVDGKSLLARLRPLAGLALLLALCLPWYVAIYLATDGAFFTAALGRDFLGKAASGQEGHGAPPLTHLALFFAIAWPLSAFALAAAWRLWRRREPAFLFAAAWALPAWLVFELVPTKLPHYTLPMLPAVALASVAALSLAEPPRAARIAAACLLVAVPLAALLALPLGLWFFGREFAEPFTLPVAVPAALLVLALVAALLAAARMVGGGQLLSAKVVAPAVIAAGLAQATIWGLVLPALSPVWLSPRLAEAARDAATCEAPRIVSIDYNEPSFVFLTNTDTALVGVADAIAIAAAQCAVVAVRDHRLEEFRAAAASRSELRLREAGDVRGFNISKGEVVELTLFATP